jgi:hypothetical protein
MVKGKIAPARYNRFFTLLPEAVKHFQVLPEYSSYLRRHFHIERDAKQIWPT